MHISLIICQIIKTKKLEFFFLVRRRMARKKVGAVIAPMRIITARFTHFSNMLYIRSVCISDVTFRFCVSGCWRAVSAGNHWGEIKRTAQERAFSSRYRRVSARVGRSFDLPRSSIASCVTIVLVRVSIYIAVDIVGDCVAYRSYIYSRVAPLLSRYPSIFFFPFFSNNDVTLCRFIAVRHASDKWQVVCNFCQNEPRCRKSSEIGAEDT